MGSSLGTRDLSRASDDFESMMGRAEKKEQADVLTAFQSERAPEYHLLRKTVLNTSEKDIPFVGKVGSRMSKSSCTTRI